MMTKKVLLVAILGTLPVFAQTPRPKPYITAEQLDVKVLLPDPAPNDSPAWKAEIDEVHRLQDTRTAAQIAAAKADDAEEDIFVFKTVLGSGFAAAKLPLTAALSARVHANEGEIVNPAKQYSIAAGLSMSTRRSTRFARRSPIRMISGIRAVTPHRDGWKRWS